MKRTLFLLVCLIGLLSACDNQPADTIKRAKLFAFGTEIDVSLYGVNESVADQAFTVLKQTFSNVNNTWHAWQPSTLTKINDAISAGESITVSDDMARLINLATTMADNSQHLFNPAAGKLFALWGFHQDDWFISRPPPEKNAINDWLSAAPTMSDISIEAGQLTSRNKMVKLGFGGFAKGVAVDAAITALQQQGITNAMVNIGGDLKVIGSYGTRSWVIGIRHPRQNDIIASIALQNDECVFTSGDYERFFEYKGRRYAHIIDPRTGHPANQATSVTVLHNNAAIADAAATALFVAGNDWPHIAKEMAISHVLLVRPDGQIEVSPPMAKRIRVIGNRAPIITRGIDS